MKITSPLTSENMNFAIVISMVKNDDICVGDSATTHTILKDKKYFSYLVMHEANVSTIFGITN